MDPEGGGGGGVSDKLGGQTLGVVQVEWFGVKQEGARTSSRDRSRAIGTKAHIARNTGGLPKKVGRTPQRTRRNRLTPASSLSLAPATSVGAFLFYKG